MKAKLFGMMGLFALVAILHGQERVPAEQAQRIAKILAEHTAKLQDLQVPTDPEPGNAFGLKSGDHAALVIPEKKLSEDTIAKTGNKPTPIGQLWVKKITTFVAGKATPNDKLRLETVTVDGQDHRLPLFLIGVRKNAEGNLELVLFGKDKEPLVQSPLRKVKVNQELPLEMAAKKGDNETAQVTFNILGQYQATVTLTKQDD